MTDVFRLVKEQILFATVASYHGLIFNHNRKAKCPFHDESTPSFHNYGSYGYCHGCGTRADIVGLECHFTGLKPFEAALSLARRYGVRI